jgi:hypothetical protein
MHQPLWAAVAWFLLMVVVWLLVVTARGECEYEGRVVIWGGWGWGSALGVDGEQVNGQGEAS